MEVGVSFPNLIFSNAEEGKLWRGSYTATLEGWMDSSRARRAFRRKLMLRLTLMAAAALAFKLSGFTAKTAGGFKIAGDASPPGRLIWILGNFGRWMDIPADSTSAVPPGVITTGFTGGAVGCGVVVGGGGGVVVVGGSAAHDGTLSPSTMQVGCTKTCLMLYTVVVVATVLVIPKKRRFLGVSMVMEDSTDSSADTAAAAAAAAVVVDARHSVTNNANRKYLSIWFSGVSNETINT